MNIKPVNPIQDRDAELRKIKSKAMALTATAFGYYENPHGETFKWDSVKREFVKSNAKNGGSLDPKQYFMDKFGMSDAGNGKLSWRDGSLWKLDFQNKKLVRLTNPNQEKSKNTK